MDKIDELLTRRVDKIYPSRSALEKVLRSGKKIKLYLGIDPTASRLHLGHTIPIRKLQEFADLGHEVILLFGTGTVLVGDPSQREKGRKLITEAEIKKNIDGWKKQIKPFIDFHKVKIKYNADWIANLSIKEIIKLGSKISAVQLFKRKSFTDRIKAGNPVWYYETMYPLLQGYDSVVMNVDLEIGGSDQMFNMLIGRELQQKINHKEKFVLTVKMILGTDGKTMSKTSNNCIWLTDKPKDIYGKVMKLQDQLIPSYFEAFTNLSPPKLIKIKKELTKTTTNPMVYKKQLALKITAQIYGLKKASQAEQIFERTIQKHQIPAKIPFFQVKNMNSKTTILMVITSLVPSKSRSEAKRLIKQKAIKINHQIITDGQQVVKKNDFVQIGRRKWVKIK